MLFYLELKCTEVLDSWAVKADLIKSLIWFRSLIYGFRSTVVYDQKQHNTLTAGPSGTYHDELVALFEGITPFWFDF